MRFQNFNQAVISKSLDGLIENFRIKYNLAEYTDIYTPCLFIGMYRSKEFRLFKKHKGQKAIIFCGSDAKLLDHKWIKKIKTADSIYSMSEFVYNTLLNHKIQSEIYQFNPTIAELWKPCPNGDKIYWYYNEGSPEFYGSEIIEEIENRIDIPIIKATYQTYSQQDLYQVYLECFVNLRLTQHDGCPNTNLQMGLMGRPSIYNGNLPHSIQWQNADDIIDKIINLYDNRKNDNSLIANDFLTFVSKY